MLQALIDINARVPLLEGCVVVLCPSLQSPSLREAQSLEETKCTLMWEPIDLILSVSAKLAITCLKTCIIVVVTANEL